MQNDHKPRYIPALDYDWATPLYDFLIRLTMPETAFKRQLIEQAQINNTLRILDLGCGTATLTLQIKRASPDAEVRGIDGDPKILKIARAKATRAELEIGLDEGMAFDLPYADGAFDRVLSSLVLHHLSAENKRRACAEVLRVLRPGGEFHVADFGKPHTLLMRFVASSLRILGGAHTSSENTQGLLPEIFRNAGFTAVEETTCYRTLFGTLALYKAQKATS